MPFSSILTHPGGAHKDEFLACCFLLAYAPVVISRREPTAEDLTGPNIAVVDVGHEHVPELGNFDHHQFPSDHPPLCSLSLVLQHFGLYEEARDFCDWLEPAEWFDTLGPIETARRLGIPRDAVFKLYSPIDGTLLRRFSKQREILPGDPLWEIMRWVGEDLKAYLISQRTQLEWISTASEIWEIEARGELFEVLFLPRDAADPEQEQSTAMAKFLGRRKDSSAVAACVYGDRRGGGYALSRYMDHPQLDFTRIADCEDVHFAHARGFVAKTSATDPLRLRRLLADAWVPKI